MTTRERLQTEFGIYSDWLVEAMSDLEPAQLIPVACRGTGRPALFHFIADFLRLGTGSLVLDLGSGLGGPAAWLMNERRCRVVGVDLMEAEVRASVRLFSGFSGVVGSAERLPWRDRCFDAVWALGVVEMVSQKARAVAELVRVLKPGGRVAVYGFFATGKPIEHGPTANRFDPPEDLLRELERNGLSIIHAAPAEAPPMPGEWQSVVEHVRSEVKRKHKGDIRLMLAETQLGSFNWLRTTGCIQDWIVVGERGAA